MDKGTVISNKDGLFVVTEMQNGQVSVMTPLRDYIARSVIVNVNGEPRRIEDIIEEHCNAYLSKVNVIEQ